MPSFSLHHITKETSNTDEDIMYLENMDQVDLECSFRQLSIYSNLTKVRKYFSL